MDASTLFLLGYLHLLLFAAWAGSLSKSAAGCHRLPGVRSVQCLHLPHRSPMRRRLVAASILSAALLAAIIQMRPQPPQLRQPRRRGGRVGFLGGLLTVGRGIVRRGRVDRGRGGHSAQGGHGRHGVHGVHGARFAARIRVDATASDVRLGGQVLEDAGGQGLHRLADLGNGLAQRAHRQAKPSMTGAGRQLQPGQGAVEGLGEAMHVARHGFATRKLVQGHDHLTVAELMGHRDGTMLAKVYGHLDRNTDHLKKALED